MTIDGKMALSLGIKATAVKATYTVTGETDVRTSVPAAAR